MVVSIANRGAVMRRSRKVRHARLASLLGLLAGGAAGLAAIAFTSAAVAQHALATPQAILEATHLPPLLTLPGEPVRLTYDVHCIAAGVEDPEQRCETSGTVFVRAVGAPTFSAIPLEEQRVNGLHQLTTSVPSDIATATDGFEYYAELESGPAGRTLVTPSGGAEAPHRVLLLADAIDVRLGSHAFGSTVHGTRLTSAPWGDGPLDVGLEEGKNLGAVGASAFDVDRSGTVFVLDQAHRRLLRWARGTTTPARVPLSIEGRLADMVVDDDGSVYVLESVARPGRRPLVRRFDEYGRELDAVETAERTPSQIRLGPAGPVVLQHPSDQWMPVAADGSPVAPERQRRSGNSGRPMRGGGEVVVLRQDDEVRVAVVGNDHVQSAWRIASQTPLGEVQLAQPLGKRLVLVVRVYSEPSAEFVVLILDRQGLARRFAVDTADWAETAPLGRFRLVNGSLYRLGSDATHAFVDRFDLEVR
jgi:hypothetical protein